MISTAAIISDLTLDYPHFIPYNPGINYPEYLFGELSNESNQVYESVRQLLLQLDLDKENYGYRNWNPLRKFIRPGNTVVIKPNWVNHFNPVEDDITSLISHSSVIRVILDYVLISLNGNGKVIIGDAPIQSCNFEVLSEKNKIIDIVKFLQPKTSVIIEIKDFRKEKLISNHGIYERIVNFEKSYITVNLRNNSFLDEIKNDYLKFRVNGYDKSKMLKHHNDCDHIYLIAEEVLQADAVIEIPKLKTHQKAGITCCLKNNVGINVAKDCLVHHRKGALDEGGDAYNKKNIGQQIKEIINENYDKADIRFLQFIYKILFKFHKIVFSYTRDQTISEGNWYGNDTVWRMIHDLNRIVFYADSSGTIKKEQQRKVLYLVDGIIGGEGEGPLRPSSIHSGILAFGIDPVLIDSCMASLMGFSFEKIPSIKKALTKELFGYGIDNLLKNIVLINGSCEPISKIINNKGFIPPVCWQNHIEK
jgi:uncharacterized protein (DUF362 family)